MKRNLQSLDKNTLFVCSLISLTDNYVVKGSLTDKLKYPKDVDIQENIIFEDTDLEKFKNKIANGLQKIGKHIKNTKDVYFLDFKACGKHWNLKQLINGKNNKINLVDCITINNENASLKIDVVQFKDSEFIEYSNVFLISKGERPKLDIIKIFNNDIQEYKQKNNFAKVLKKKYSIAKYSDNKEEMEKLDKLFNSDFGLLYKIIGELDTMILVLSIYNDSKIKNDVLNSTQKLKQMIGGTKLELPKNTYNWFDKIKENNLPKSLIFLKNKLNKVLQSFALQFK